MQKLSAGRGKAIQKFLNAVFLSPSANKAWTAAAAGTAGYMVGSDVLNETIAPAVQKDVQPHIDRLADTFVRGGRHLDEIAHAGEKAIRDSRLQDTVTDAKNIMLDNVAAGTQQALVASLAAGGGAAGGYGLATLLSENPNYRMPAALLGAALGGTAGMLYPKLIKSSNAQLIGAPTMLNTNRAASELSKDAGFRDVVNGGLSFLKRFRAPKSTAVGRFTGNIKPWAQKATFKLPPGTGLALGGTVATGALGQNLINNYYDDQIAGEQMKQRDLDMHRETLNRVHAYTAAQRAREQANKDSAAPAQPRWAEMSIGAGLGGLAGYGVGAALTKNKIIRLLAALGGGAMGGYVGNAFANQHGKKASLELSTAERIMCKIATREGAGLCTLTSFAVMRKTATGEQTPNGAQAPTIWDTIREWATADNYKNLKRVGTGLGVGLGTYALSGLLPGARKDRGARALLAGAAGLGAGLYGDKLVNGLQSYFNRNTAQQEQPKREQVDKTPKPEQTSAQAAPAAALQIPTYQDYVRKLVNGPQFFQPAQTLDKPFTPKPQPQYGPRRQPQVNLPTYQDFVRRMVSGPQLFPVQGGSPQQPQYGPRVR